MTKTKTGPSSLGLIGGILIALLGIVGCSDMPYTGSMLTAADVDQYVTINEDSACLLVGGESACLTLLPETEDESRPVIHIHPRKVIYVFYREGVPILQAEIVTDTTEIMEEVSDAVADEPPSTDDVDTAADDDTQQDDDSTTPADGDDNAQVGDSVEDDQLPNGGIDTGTQLPDGGTQQPEPEPQQPEPQPQPTTLEAVSGDGQRAEINQQLENPLVVRVRDQNGDVLSGITVTFSVDPTSGTLSPTSATTAANGEASTELTLGGTIGDYTVTVSVSGIAQPVTFTATAVGTPDPDPQPDPDPEPDLQPTTLEVVSGNNQRAEINQQLENPLVVRVRDQNGDVLSGITVNFSVSPSGTLSPQSATTAANGEASTELTLGGTIGDYTVTVSVSGIAQPVTFTATAFRTTQPPQPESEKTISVRGGTSADLTEIGVIDLRIRTGEQHMPFQCEAGYRRINVTAYSDIGRTQERAHQHWAACIDSAGNVTIFLYNHPELTCATGPNTHYLVITDNGVKVTEAGITIKELVEGSGAVCD